ncbi:MAG TPA: type I glyceraldehyde-3-phosphate dehydrogenase [Thermoanaerobaculia bacterium]|nr:type I glyceraldehyde-3-phosphate dehydrogenase [Thermoanaerobaculia bacterium]HUM28614.1 type I glyceraldehyde-3-phosphate dehydrogenase [Thermoanaerobaculia bacterium]HXK66778.1 type I glyceraldehyde-3-phosphate dehydrogenase [Thermoanaerobaculia bacterium]
MKIGINGFGRIGRGFLREVISRKETLDVVAINDITDAKTLAHLLKYDSVHGVFPHDVKAGDGTVIVDGKSIAVYAERDPSNIPWEKHGVEVVLESTGLFRKKADAMKHLRGSVRNVVISAPAKDEDITVVVGINDDKLDASIHKVISNASCTTNATAVTLKPVLDRWTFVEGYLLTVHAYTNDQRILDLPHSDPRRARAAALSMIPTSTGAAKAVALVMPEVKGKFNGMSLRVPTPNVSFVSLTVTLKESPSVDELREAFRTDAGSHLKGLLDYTEEPVVSIDMNGSRASATLDATLLDKVGDNTYAIFSWYDNETGYNNRLIDVIRKL